MVLFYKKEIPLTCQRGLIGRNCNECAPNFGPPGQYDQCLTGWAGLDCDSCAKGFTGDNCTMCDTNFGPDGQCNKCVTGRAGDNCDMCEFGFSAGSNCTECIQNGFWTGTFSTFATMTVSLTFEGPTWYQVCAVITVMLHGILSCD